jgi:hypothetical protein
LEGELNIVDSLVYTESHKGLKNGEYSGRKVLASAHKEQEFKNGE